MSTPKPSFDLPAGDDRPAESGMLAQLRTLTPARIMLERSGDALTTPALLNFELAHARARDAVVASLDVDALAEALCAIGAPVNGAAALRVRSRAPNRAAYLARPDWGRRLLATSATELEDSSAAAAIVPDLVFVIADGLSAIAVQAHAPPLLQALMPLLPGHLHCGPPVIAEQARVALGDEIGALLKARCVVVLIGERPGLSAPDSLGIYVTWAPVVGRNDAERNCISNVRPGGLVPAEAAQELAELLAEIFTAGKSGVLLAPAAGFTTKLDPSLPGAE